MDRSSPLIQLELQRLAHKAEKARLLCGEVVNARKVSIALNTLERVLANGENFEESFKKRLWALLRFADERALVPEGHPLRLTPSCQLHITTVEDALSWGATHWSMPPREQGEPALVVLMLREENGTCVECGMIQDVFQPINQEGGSDAICNACLSALDWISPVALGDLPTHITQT